MRKPVALSALFGLLVGMATVPGAADDPFGASPAAATSLKINAFSSNRDFLTPNGDNYEENVTFTGHASGGVSPLSWTITIRNSTGTVVRNVSGTGGSASFTWDGRSNAGSLVNDDNYTAYLVVKDVILNTVSASVNVQNRRQLETVIQLYVADTNSQMCPGGPPIPGPRVICYGESLHLDDPQYVVLQGTRSPREQGCIGPTPELPSPIGVYPMVGEAIALDPDTCTALYRIGEDTEEATRIDTSLGGLDHDVQWAWVTNTQTTPAASTRYWVKRWAWTDEPERWLRGVQHPNDPSWLPPVTVVRPWINWEWSANCAVAPLKTAGQYEDTWWFSTSTWHKLPMGIWATNTAGQQSCPGAVWSDSYVFYRNDKFCDATIGVLFRQYWLVFMPPIFQTDAIYEGFFVKGFASGAGEGDNTGNIHLRGPCSYLLKPMNTWDVNYFA